MLSERNCLKTFNELPTEKYYAMSVYTIWLSISLYKLFVDELQGRPKMMMCITIPTMLGLTLTFYPSPNPNINKSSDRGLTLYCLNINTAIRSQHH